MTLRDSVNPAHLTFVSSSPAPDSTSPPGTIVWNDLTAIFGPLTPNRTVNLTVTYQVNPLAPNVSNTTNVATVEGVRDSFGNGLPPQTGTATVSFPPPLVPPNPTPTDDKASADQQPAAPPRPAPPPALTPTPLPLAAAPTPTPLSGLAPAPPGATPTMPVTVLPETGLNEGSWRFAPLGGVLGLALIVSWWLIRSNRRQK
jgi:hypothetical protein